MILFRCDSSDEIGTGHVFRCLTMAEHLGRLGFRCGFLTRKMLPQLEALIESKASLIYLPEREDLEAELLLIRARNPSFVVLDHYGVFSEWQKRVREICRLVLIDDNADRPLCGDILFNFNYGISAKDYRGVLNTDCRLYLGPGVSLMKEAVLGLRADPPPKKNQLFCFFGGTDPAGETEKLCAALTREKSPDSLQPLVFVGATNQARERIMRLTSERFEICSDPAVFHLRLAESQAFLGAGGSVTYERLFLGVPGFVVGIAENQVHLSEALARDGYQSYLGFRSEIDYDQVLRKIRSTSITTLARYRQKGLELVRTLPDQKLQDIFS